MDITVTLWREDVNWLIELLEDQYPLGPELVDQNPDTYTRVERILVALEATKI